MKADFWHQMWESKVLGFHQADVNPFLIARWSKLDLKERETVLVPLCGKSLDMLWLVHQGWHVLGVELNQSALEAFVSENGLSANPVKHESFDGYELDRMTLLCGDFFKLSKQDCQDVKAVYDRAAIVALPPEMRQAYALHLQSILPKRTTYLMVVMEYDQSLMSGPPFSVPELELRHLFADFQSIEKVDEVVFERKGVQTKEMAFVMIA